MMKKLTRFLSIPRISSILDTVPRNGVVADIGADHGIISAGLSKFSSLVYAVEMSDLAARDGVISLIKELDIAEKVIVKMKENNKYGLGEAECREMLMNQMVSDDKEENVLFDGDKKWLNVIKVRNVSYLNMEKSFQINFLNTACDNKIEKIKST